MCAFYGATMYGDEMHGAGVDRRLSQPFFAIMKKTSMTSSNTDSIRECELAADSRLPFDFVPPPQALLLNTVPYKWPSDSDWDNSRSATWYAPSCGGGTPLSANDYQTRK